VAVVTSVDDVMPRTWKLNANSSCHDSDATFALTLSVRTPNPTGGRTARKAFGRRRFVRAVNIIISRAW
jgi:hypothetical protein